MSSAVVDLGSRILVGSGAMGTVLRQGAETAGEPVELLNLRPADTRLNPAEDPYTE